MTTLTKLSTHLIGNVTETIPGLSYKAVTKPIECKDGVTLSVQASENHYCEPRDNKGPYTEVEVWCIRNCTAPVTQFEYEADEPSGYVPIEQVAAFIDQHGGFKE